MTRASTKLALDGGTPVRKEPILPGWPGGLLIGAEEKAQVLEVLESQTLYRHYGPHPGTRRRSSSRSSPRRSARATRWPSRRGPARSWSGSRPSGWGPATR